MTELEEKIVMLLTKAKVHHSILDETVDGILSVLPIPSLVFNLKNEKFLADLKAAIELGHGIDFIYEPNINDRICIEVFDTEEAMRAVIKVLEGETTTCESCHKTVPLEWAHDRDVKVYSDAYFNGPNDISVYHESYFKTTKEMNHAELKETLSHYIPEDSVLNEILNIIPHWIPIDEAGLVDGEIYDTYSIEYGRIPDCMFRLNKLNEGDNWFSSKYLRPSLDYKQVTHIMKRPVDPEI